MANLWSLERWKEAVNFLDAMEDDDQQGGDQG